MGGNDPWALVEGCRVIDLAQPLEAGMPVSPNHPGFKMSLMRRHGDMVRADGGSASNEMIVIGGHTGTHIDALCHVSHDGMLYGGVEASAAQKGGRFKIHDVASIEPMLCRGVLLDIAALRGVECLEPGERVTAGDLEQAARKAGVEPGEGDVVLIRTGWPHYWDDVPTFMGQVKGAPGPDEEAAHWIAERGVRLAGAETVAFEWIPPGKGHALLPAHRVLLVEHGIHILEMMDLGPLARSGKSEFLFVLAPLKIVGATGVPVRPLAVVR